MTPEEIAAKAAADKAAADQKAADDAKKAADEVEAAKQTNAENAAQRLLKKAEKDRDEALAELQKRKDAELSETDRLKKEADDAKKEAADAKREALILKVGKDLPEEALEFLTASDEDALRVQAGKLAAAYGTKTEPKVPVVAGTKTNPAANQQPTTQEKIAAAQKSGNVAGAIALMRGEQFGSN